MSRPDTTLPGAGVPVQSKTLNGLDSLLSIVQMPRACPSARCRDRQRGATNAALTAVAILAAARRSRDAALKTFRRRQTEAVLEQPDPRVAP